MYGSTPFKVALGPIADAVAQKTVENSPNTFSQAQVAGFGPAQHAEKTLEQRAQDREAAFQQELRQKYPLAFQVQSAIGPVQSAFVDVAQRGPKTIR